MLGRGPWREGVPGGRLRESCAIGLQLSVGGAFEGAGSWGAGELGCCTWEALGAGATGQQWTSCPRTGAERPPADTAWAWPTPARNSSPDRCSLRGGRKRWPRKRVPKAAEGPAEHAPAPPQTGEGAAGTPLGEETQAPGARWDLSGGPEGTLAEAGKEEERVKACLPSSRVCFLGTSTRQSCFVFCFLVLFPGSIQNISLRCPQKDALVGTPDSPFPKPPRLVRHRRWTHTQPHTPLRPRASGTLVPVP